MTAFGRKATIVGVVSGQPVSDFRSLCHLKGIVDIYPKIADCTLQLGMSK